MKLLHALTTLTILSTSTGALAVDIPFPEQTQIPPASASQQKVPPPAPILSGPRPGHTGFYLAGRHAQAVQDWHAANYYLDIAARKDPGNTELKRRAMVIAMGAGDLEMAAEYAAEIIRTAPGDPLASLFLTARAISQKEYSQAQNTLEAMDEGGMSEFASPLIKTWLKAGQGELDLSALSPQPLNAFHAALASKILRKDETGRTFINRVQQESDTARSLKLADALFVLDQKDSAKVIYQALNKEVRSHAIKNRLKAIQKKNVTPFFEPQSVTQGLALAFLDMSKILSTQDSIDSARIFAHIALNIDPSLEEAHILLSKIYTESGQFEQALAHYNKIPANSRYALDINIKISEIHESHGHVTKAIQELETFYNLNPHVDIIVQIGDIYRRDGNSKAALPYYDRAIAHFQEGVPDEYWYLYYVRGMTYESTGAWEQAESDFEKALEYRPSDPFVLNYLAYGWVERGENLSKSLEYLEKAVARRPTDGHIRDSLGWALYKLERYENSIEPLEKAISYLPYDPIVNEHLGDAYWKVGRKREALFQWKRALNHIDSDAPNTDPESLRLKEKLVSGLPLPEQVLSAENKVQPE